MKYKCPKICMLYNLLFMINQINMIQIFCTALLVSVKTSIFHIPLS